MVGTTTKKEIHKLKLVKLKDDGKDINYAKFKAKSKFKLDWAGLWKYIESSDSNMPVVPEL